MGITNWDRESCKMNACQLSCACSENVPSNTVGTCGLAGVYLIKNLSHVGLREQDHAVPWVSGVAHAQLGVVFVKAYIKCIEFVW